MKNPFIIILYLNITGCLDIELTFKPTCISMLYFLVNWFQPQPQPYRSLISCLARIAHTPRSCRPSHFLLSNFQISPDSFKRLRCANIIVSRRVSCSRWLHKALGIWRRNKLMLKRNKQSWGTRKKATLPMPQCFYSTLPPLPSSIPSACLSCDYVPISCLWFCVPHDK